MEIEARKIKGRHEVNDYEDLLTQISRFYSLAFLATKPPSHKKRYESSFFFYSIPTFFFDLPQAEELFKLNLQKFNGNSSLAISFRESHEGHKFSWKQLRRRKIIYPPMIKLFYFVPYSDQKASLVYLSVPGHKGYGSVYLDSINFNDPNLSTFKKSLTATRIREVNEQDFRRFNESLKYIHKTSLPGLIIKQNKRP